MNEYDQQALKFLEETNTEFKAKFLKHGKHFGADDNERDIYKITLKKGDRVFKFDFGQSIANSGLGKKPTAYDVLTCLTKNDVGSFEDFCGDFGYEEDSRKAEKIYKAVVNEWENIQILYTDEEIEKLQEIQ